MGYIRPFACILTSSKFLFGNFNFEHDHVETRPGFTHEFDNFLSTTCP